MLCVIDTNVLVAGLRSPRGASAELLRRVLREEIAVALTVALALEYEAVAARPEHLAAAGLSEAEARVVIDAVIAVARPVETRFLWRPHLRDPDDEMVLEAAVNGQADAIVTYNLKDFRRAEERFALRLETPGAVLRRAPH